ncbi:MAG: response regulator [Nitrospirales bacterium]|nr:response regulator [Nitrospirales bacterium]
MFSGESSEGLILVVDDEPAIRKILRLILEKAGYGVIEAEDGEQAIQAVQSGENPLVLDMIITDIRMPKLNGVEAIQYFQREFPRVPVIVLTGHPDTQMAVTMMKEGIVDYLTKPFEKERLLASVKKGMEQRELHHL